MKFKPVAIIAADCMLPGAYELKDFYERNMQAHCAIRRAMPTFWGEKNLYTPDPHAINHSYSDIGAFLDPWELDTRLFRIPPASLKRLDPVHGLGLELARRVITQCEAQATLPHEDTAIIVANVMGGVKTRKDVALHLESRKWTQRARELLPEVADLIWDYQQQFLQRYPHAKEEASLNHDSASIAGRIANYFNFRGPHYAIDAACASSAAVLHSACMGLHQGEFKAALVGAISRLSPEFFIVNSKAHTLSPDGSRPFDERANGFVPGEGGIMLMLLPLEKAIAAGYSIKGIITSIGYSCNGRSTVSWAPSVDAEMLAIQRAFIYEEFNGAQIDYLEAHGTSTHLGDKAEFEAIRATYGRDLSKGQRSLPFGSVKSMIGHLVEGAGLAGVLRALFVFEHHMLPPTVNVTNPRSDLPFAESHLQLQTECAPLSLPQDRPLRVGVSSFGYGGSNYHILLQAYEPQKRKSAIFPSAKREAVAIIAMDVIAPDAPDIETFWQNLCQGHTSQHDLRTYIPMLDLYLHRAEGTYLSTAAIVQLPVLHELRMFRLLPKSLKTFSSEQLLLLQITARIVQKLQKSFGLLDLARAGCIIGQIPDSDSVPPLFNAVHFPGWFQGLCEIIGDHVDSARLSATERALLEDTTLALNQVIDEDTSVSGEGSILASRIAMGLGFQGKHYTVRAACSTGLTAVSLALQELRQHTLDFVLCGSTSMGLDISNQSVLAAIHALSEQGVVRPYDKHGDGFIIGSGAGMLALKRLADAERDGDEIIAVIRDACGSSDGKGLSLLAPNVVGRKLAMQRVYERTGIHPTSIQYVEGHGAATSAGDETEISAIADTLQKKTITYVGSVKGNIGHLKAAAGMVALIKTALCLHHRVIVPSAGYQEPNPHLNLEMRHIVIPTACVPWEENDEQPRRAAVNAFGLAGNNYHAVLEEYIPLSPIVTLSANSQQKTLHCLCWSASSRETLIMRLKQFMDSGEIDTPLPGEAYRAAILCTDDYEQARNRVQKLLQYIQGQQEGSPRLEALDIFYCPPELRPSGAVCFLLPGQGSQYAEMLRSLPPLIPEVTSLIEEAAMALQAELPGFYHDFWLADHERSVSWLAETAHCQVATLIASILLANWLEYIGVQPDLLLGHSFGDFSALTLAHTFSFADSLRLAYWRGILAGRQTQNQQHAMAVLFTSSERAQTFISQLQGAVFLANRNSPFQVVISGRLQAVQAVLKAASLQGIQSQILPISRAYHSPLMAPSLLPFMEQLQSITMQPPQIPVYQTRTTVPYIPTIPPDEIRKSLAHHYITRVDFISMVEDAYERGARIFIEVGPKKALTGFARDILGKREALFLPLLHPKGGEQLHLLRAWAQLWVANISSTLPRVGNQVPQSPHSLQMFSSSSAVRVMATDTQTDTLTVALRPIISPIIALRPIRSWQGKRVVIVGDETGLVAHVVALLQHADALVRVTTMEEILSEYDESKTSQSSSLNHNMPVDWLFFLPGYDSSFDTDRPLKESDALRVKNVLRSLRNYLQSKYEHWQQRKEGGIALVTRLDGRLGHTMSQRADPLGGALIGFLRAVKMELPYISTCIVDYSPFISPPQAAWNLLHTAAATTNHLEVGVFGQELVQAILSPAYSHPEAIPGALIGTLPLTVESILIVTGGARGVTAKVVEALACEVPCHFILLGTTVLKETNTRLHTLSVVELQQEKMKTFRRIRQENPNLTPVVFEQYWQSIEKTLEINRTLTRLRQLGARVEYRVVDITDAQAVALFREQIQHAGYSITGLIHGAAIEKSKLLWDQAPTQWDRTLAVKLGVHHLFPLLGPQTRMILFFGSIAGTAGGYGQTDYSAGCEYLSRLAYRLGADFPQARVCTIAWPAWDEVGLAMRETTRAYFEKKGLHYMPVAEGIRWVLAALRSPLPCPELIIVPKDFPQEMFNTRSIQVKQKDSFQPHWYLLHDQCAINDHKHLMSRTLNPEQDGYLFHHRVGEHARLPFACLIEFIAEAVASLCGSHHVITIKDLSITEPLVLADGRPRQIFVEVERLPDNVTYKLVIYSYPLLPDLTWLPRRIVIACAQAIVANTPRLPNTLSIDTNLPLSFTAGQAYEIFARESVYYGPLFQGLGSFYASDHSAYCVSLQARQETMPSPETKSFYNVALLDLACQSLAYILQGQPGGLPIRCNEIAIFTQSGNPQSSGYAFSTLPTEHTTALDVTLADQRGNVLAILQGIQLQSRVSRA